MSIVIPRDVWKPRYSDGEPGVVIGTAAWEAAGRELWAHHSTTNPPGPDATLEQDCAHMREFEAIGQSRFGQGISYTWVIMPSGRVFQGHDVDRRGAHTYQRNDRSRAVCFAGDYDVRDLPDRMAHAAAALLRELGATFDGGHRDVYPTACPGRYAYARLGEINRLATTGAPLHLEDDDIMAMDPQQLEEVIARGVHRGVKSALTEDLYPNLDPQANGGKGLNIVDALAQVRERDLGEVIPKLGEIAGTLRNPPHSL